MDEELKTFEDELSRLRPLAPSAALEERVGGQLRPAAARARAPRRPTRWVWWTTLPAAAAAALLLSRHLPQPPLHVQAGAAAAPGGVLKPVAAENVLYSARDEGLVVLADGTPARRERLQFVDTITWKNPRTNASLHWTVPREEVRVVPITFQ